MRPERLLIVMTVIVLSALTFVGSGIAVADSPTQNINATVTNDCSFDPPCWNIVEVGEPRHFQSTNDQFVEGMGVAVRIHWHGFDASRDVELEDYDGTANADDFLGRYDIETDTGTKWVVVPWSAISDALQDDDDSDELELKLSAYGSCIGCGTDRRPITRTNELVFLDPTSVPESTPEGSQTTVTIYGWSSNSAGNWELRESDPFINDLIKEGSTLTSTTSTSFEQDVTFEASSGDDGDNQIDIFMKSTDSGFTSPTQAISLT